MFGDTEIFNLIAEKMLDDFSLEDILEANDLSDVEALAVLIREGLIDTEFYEVHRGADE